MPMITESSGKTPISELNEHAAKLHWKLPDFTLIDSRNGTHINSFTYRVNCNSLEVCGTAANKKDAKQLAAKNMIEKLKETGNMTINNSSDGASEESFVNFVGKLNEYCVNDDRYIPVYNDIEAVGPSHSPTFTVQCKVGGLVMKATANTKKKAKQNAAELMLNQLVRNRSPTLSSMMDTDDSDDKRKAMNFTLPKFNIANSGDENKDPDFTLNGCNILDLTRVESRVEKSIEKAKLLLPTLKRYNATQNVSSPKNVAIDDLHQVFKVSYDSFVQETVQSMIKNNVLPKEELLNDIASLLGLNIEYNRIGRQKELVMVVATLNSMAKITDVGIGKTYTEAKNKAMELLLKTIEILFK